MLQSWRFIYVEFYYIRFFFSDIYVYIDAWLKRLRTLIETKLFYTAPPLHFRKKGRNYEVGEFFSILVARNVGSCQMNNCTFNEGNMSDDDSPGQKC